MPDLFETIMPVAAAESIRGKDMNNQEDGDGKYDVLITMNNKTPWYDGADGTPPEDRYDFVTVCLHEFYHNLVFAGSIVAEVDGSPDTPEDVLQNAHLHKEYRTRFDSFLANKQGCAVLSYLDDERLQANQQKSGTQLLADACTNNELYFQQGETKIARMFAPRIFKARSSVYHLDPKLSDPDSKLMFPTITRGTSVHRISTTILNIQAATLRKDWHGANTKCTRPLAAPGLATPPQSGDWGEETAGAGVQYHDSPVPVPRAVVEDNVRRIANLPVWAFALLIVLAIILALLLLALCLALLLRRKKKRSFPATTSSTSRFPTHTHSSTTSTLTKYIPGFGNVRTSSRKTHSSFSRHHPSSKHTSSKVSKHTTSKGTSRHSRDETLIDSHKTICPSSGKYIYICKCKCCRKETTIQRPEPIASVHEFVPESPPSAEFVCYKRSHRRCHHHRSSRHPSHKHSAVKSLKKPCKSKSVRSCHHGCHCCYCCKYKPASSKSSAKCSKSIAATSTKSESVVCKSCKSASCRCSSAMSCKTCKSFSCKCSSSVPCKTCKSSSCKCSSSVSCKTCKSSSCKCSSSVSCKTCKSSSCKCSSSVSCRTCKSSSCKCSASCRSCKSTSCRCGSSTKGASSTRAPPSTRPPPPPTKAPSTKRSPSCKPATTACPPTTSARTCCKPAASGAACKPTCRRVVEININRC
ncbi:unnamed protein product [Chondrus crispus]|uniref:Uncharacterized protein n=1 Tax=Chondrus crispus TaxID=2769 RepID=R7QS63_CHOCR|nr:unnamed protein product [Chondrus crispus]CDF41327.1 unnamed protein product [Chondrus crispus]|eukprot:XP_005711621.1 unnamed protein product [Chondrus crispus]